MSCENCGTPAETFDCLTSQLEALIAAANALRNQRQLEEPGQTAPGLCPTPTVPEGASDSEKIAGLKCRIEMVLAYIECINGDSSNWNSCVSNVCSNFTTCWNLAFNLT